jgi:hypothetical protein
LEPAAVRPATFRDVHDGLEKAQQEKRWRFATSVGGAINALNGSIRSILVTKPVVDVAAADFGCA